MARRAGRNRKGQFVKGASRKRTTKRRRRRSNPVAASNPPARRRRRRRAASSSSSSPRRRRRRNPGTSPRGLLRQLTTGLKDAAGIVVGEAGARSLPLLLKLPQQGAMGLGVQAASGLALGWAADRFLGREVGRMVLAGALAAPLRTAIVAHKVPFLSQALSPTSSAQSLGAYKGLRAYVPAGPAGRSMGAYVAPARLGSYVRGGRSSAPMAGYNFATQ